MKAHRTDLVSFAFGLVFLALSGWWLLAQLLGLALPAVGWFLASALILIGVFGLVGALRSGRSQPPEATTEATGATGATAPVSGATAPVSGAAVPTSGAPLPVWEAEKSTWDAPSSATTPEAPTTEVIHPAWLAHPPSEPQTSAIPGRPHDRHEEPTVGLGTGPAPAEGDEPTRSDHPIETVGDQADDEREGRRGKA
ncbi:hypothetical protein GA0070612_2032 [Micromonospora chokoriensis]|uniref:Uncharacterized protein n=1 Tax=Micromonospora chokoriensis TaxID=356851 RepID=A0A1C4W1L9_9ACTN|nr:hypothetical protein GA0070612_2032 [Micromonospora chokoriensis]